MTRSIGIAIPCYNESASLAELVRRLSSPELKSIKFVLVDNGSTDDTHSILQNLNLPENITWIQVPLNQGYGHGILMGLQQLNTNYLGWTHADLQSDPIDFLSFQEKLESNSDFLKGTRRGRPWSDRFFTAGMSFFTSILFGHVLRDVNGQPTILSRDLYEMWKSPPIDFGLDLFSYIQAIKSKARIVRVEVDFGKRLYGKSSWNSGIISRLRFIRRTLILAVKLRLDYRD